MIFFITAKGLNLIFLILLCAFIIVLYKYSYKNKISFEIQRFSYDFYEKASDNCTIFNIVNEQPFSILIEGQFLLYALVSLCFGNSAFLKW